MSMFDRDFSPRRPIAQSLTSANAEFSRWLAQNTQKDHVDALGLVWTVTTQHTILPDPVNRHASIHRLSFELKTQISRRILIERGVLDASKDQRLCELMDDSIITFVYQRPAFETDRLEKVRSQVLEDLVKIRQKLAGVDLSPLYRKVIGRWVNSRFAMTYPPVTIQQIKIDLEV
ncbi:MAG: hypothetical protein V4655_04260 [Bdellovibrionota bacterium]|nr:MAG: hypothetical protein EOP10_23850 [Pseudomonadota bacterium]